MGTPTRNYYPNVAVNAGFYDANEEPTVHVYGDFSLTSNTTVAATLVTDSNIGAVADTYVDQGAEISCGGYKTVAIFVDFTVNDSTTNTLQVLSKHTSGGASEYVMDVAADYQKVLGDGSKTVVYFFDTNAISFLQIQTKAAVIGATAGTVTINVTREN